MGHGGDGDGKSIPDEEVMGIQISQPCSDRAKGIPGGGGHDPADAGHHLGGGGDRSGGGRGGGCEATNEGENGGSHSPSVAAFPPPFTASP